MNKNNSKLCLRELQIEKLKTFPHFDNRIYVTNCRHKAKIFNAYFADRCKISDTGSVLLEFISKTNESLSHINISSDQIVDIIQKYNTTKAHGRDDISVAKHQLAHTGVAFIFQKCVITGTFPDPWKNANVQAIYKKSNYNPIIDLIRFCLFLGKFLEKIEKILFSV